ncbi:MAG TPA: hypothetical protein VLC30_02160 [Pseudomonas sp.]|nr:hypothetical protein [Pseudomonas sp.]
MNDSKQPATPREPQAEPGLPRDFDIRARYAEQQELLVPHGEQPPRAPAPAAR